jgi:hypothetical protein
MATLKGSPYISLDGDPEEVALHQHRVVKSTE